MRSVKLTSEVVEGHVLDVNVMGYVLLKTKQGDVKQVDLVGKEEAISSIKADGKTLYLNQKVPFIYHQHSPYKTKGNKMKVPIEIRKSLLIRGDYFI